MSHTFSSLSPKQQVSAQPESKNMLQVFAHNHSNVNPTGSKRLPGEEMGAFINPFSIAARKDSDQNTEGEVTAEGFYKAPDAIEMPKRDDTATSESLPLSPSLQRSKGLSSQPGGAQQMSPFDVVL